MIANHPEPLLGAVLFLKGISDHHSDDHRGDMIDYQ